MVCWSRQGWRYACASALRAILRVRVMSVGVRTLETHGWLRGHGGGGPRKHVDVWLGCANVRMVVRVESRSESGNKSREREQEQREWEQQQEQPQQAQEAIATETA